MRRQAQMEIAHGESFRHDALRVKSLEKELDRAREGHITINLEFNAVYLKSDFITSC